MTDAELLARKAYNQFAELRRGTSDSKIIRMAEALGVLAKAVEALAAEQSNVTHQVRFIASRARIPNLTPIE